MTKTLLLTLLVALSLPVLAEDVTYTNERGQSAKLHTQTLDTFEVGTRRVAIGTVTHFTPGALRVKYLVTCLPCSAGWLCGGERYTVVAGSLGEATPWITNGGTIGDDIAYDVCFWAVQKQMGVAQ